MFFRKNESEDETAIAIVLIAQPLWLRCLDFFLFFTDVIFDQNWVVAAHTL